jgi:hypothetical protein
MQHAPGHEGLRMTGKPYGVVVNVSQMVTGRYLGRLGTVSAGTTIILAPPLERSASVHERVTSL